LEQKRIQEEMEAKSKQIEETAATIPVRQAVDGNREIENIEINKSITHTKEHSDISEQVCESKEITGEKMSNEEPETQTISTEDDKNSNPDISKEITIKNNTTNNSNQASENDEVIDNHLDNNDEKLT